MKKKRIVFLSIFIMVISITLSANKNVSALTTINCCPAKVIIEQAGELEYIPGIKVPRYIMKSLDGNILNYSVITTNKSAVIEDGQYSKDYEMQGNIPKFSDNSEENSYYSQLFLWWIDDIHYQENNLTEEEKELIKNSPNGKKIVDKVEEYMNFENSDHNLVLNDINTENITYTVTDNYIETSLIIPDCAKDYSYMFTDYQVNVPSPITVVDKEGNNATEFQRGEGFKLRIPISEIKDGNMNISAEVIGKSTLDIWESYSMNPYVKGIGISSYIINCNQSESNLWTNVVNLNYMIQLGNLNINVIDTETKEKLSNATISIFDSLGNIVYQTTTTNKEINITLPVGNYTVKQTVTPENYQPVIIEKKVAVIENQESEAVLENIKLVEVPDLGQRVKGIVTMIGGITVIIGGSMIGINLIKKKNN